MPGLVTLLSTWPGQPQSQLSKDQRGKGTSHANVLGKIRGRGNSKAKTSGGGCLHVQLWLTLLYRSGN